MADLCNHTSVGVIVEDTGGRVLLFDRQTWPLFKACPAGHVDELDGIPDGRGHSAMVAYLHAAVRELEEETGLRVRPRDMGRPALTATTKNQCRRDTVDGGPYWHLWCIYRVVAPRGQNARGNPREAKGLRWYTPAEIGALADLEPVWREFLRTLHVI